MNFKKGDILFVNNYKIKLLGEPYYGYGIIPVFPHKAWRAEIEHISGNHMGLICHSFNLEHDCVLFERSGTKRIIKKLELI